MMLFDCSMVFMSLRASIYSILANAQSSEIWHYKKSLGLHKNTQIKSVRHRKVFIDYGDISVDFMFQISSWKSPPTHFYKICILCSSKIVILFFFFLTSGKFWSSVMAELKTFICKCFWLVYIFYSTGFFRSKGVLVSPSTPSTPVCTLYRLAHIYSFVSF